MCNCLEIPDAAAEVGYWDRGFNYQGLSENSACFSPPDGNSLQPSLDYSCFLYRCGECGQYWYIECAPEEQPFPLFALKLDNSFQPTHAEVQTAKERLCLVAHGGFEEALCKVAGCSNHALKGRTLCYSTFHFHREG